MLETIDDFKLVACLLFIKQSAPTIPRRSLSILFTFTVRAIDKTKLGLIEIHPICRHLELSRIKIEVILAQDEDTTEIAIFPSNIETLDDLVVSACRLYCTRKHKTA